MKTNQTAVTFFVIYLWRGERHRHFGTFPTIAAARALAARLRNDGWNAWVEW